MSSTLSYLTTLYGTASSNSGTGSLLATLYGQGGPSVNPFGGNPVTALTSAELKQTQAVKATAAQPEVNRAVNAFRRCQQCQDGEDLLANPAVMKVLLTANGLAIRLHTALAQRPAIRRDRPEVAGQQLTTHDGSPSPRHTILQQETQVIQDPKVITRSPMHARGDLAPVAGRDHAGLVERPDIPQASFDHQLG